MNRIDAMFASARNRGRTALVPYIACGHPKLDSTVPVMHQLVAAGADLIELGVPFSDPMADGPVIQRASEVALNQGVTLDQVFDCVRQFRVEDQTTPVILMGYMNPIEKIGVETFAQNCASHGVDGALIVDLPPEEGALFKEAMGQHALHQIMLVAPTSPESRIEAICDHAGGFIYYVSLKGITGAANLAAEQVSRAIRQLKSKSDVPVGVGFGIKTADDAVALSQQADAVVIGSALVAAIGDAGTKAPSAASEFLTPIRRALDQADAAANAA